MMLTCSLLTATQRSKMKPIISLRTFRFAKSSQWGGPFLAVLLAFTGLFATNQLHAQVLSGVTGTVTDPSGAIVPGVEITVTNVATGVPQKTTSTSAGLYALRSLYPGNYTIEASAPGFTTYVQNGVQVETGDISTINIQLKVGSSQQTVEVTSEGIALNTTQPQLNTVIEPKLLDALPIEVSGFARQIDQFVFLTPGVQGDPWNKNMNGGLNFESGLVMNGIPIVQVNMQGQQTYMNPPYEMVSEFNVVQSTFTSNYGLAQGVATYQMASGTNRYHGDAFEINRNNFFDSDGFFPSNFNAQGKPIPPVNHENNYGFSLGGPLGIPRLYSGKDRTFFHFSSDWFKENIPETAIGSVPTQAMKGGDFSNFHDVYGNQIPIIDPQTGAQFQCNGELNVICQSRFSALAQAILPLIPNPNLTGQVGGLQDNIAPVVKSAPFTQNLWGFTVDHSITSSQTVRLSVWEDNQHQVSFSQAPIVPMSSPLQSAWVDYNYASGYLLSYTKTFRPNLVMTAGASYVAILDGQANGGPHESFSAVQGSEFFPSIAFGGNGGQNTDTSWGVGSGAVGNTDHELGTSLVNNWLWTIGRHALNIGWEYRRGYDTTTPDVGGAGQFIFSNYSTSNPASSIYWQYWGSSFASFLLGSVDSASRTNAIETHIHSYDVSPYVQDDFRFTKRLTFNLGLRWDMSVPFEERNNRIIYMNPSLPDAGAGNLHGGTTQFGSCAACAGIDRASIHWGHFGPRAGFAYQLTKNTVVQAGVYISVLNGGANEFGSSGVAGNMSPLLAGEFVRTSTGTNVPGYGSWDTNVMPNPTPNPINSSMANGLGVTYFNPAKADTAPYEEAWNINIQRQLPWKMFANAAYVYNHDVHLPSNLNLLNQPNPSVLQYGSLLNDEVTSTAAQAAGIQVPYASFVSQFGAGATVIQALRPYPQYAGITNIYDMEGTAEYKGLQTQLQKRFSNGLSFLASETLSKTMANQDRLYFTWNYNTPVNTDNLAPEWAVAANDQKYLTRLVATYELPIGRDKLWLNHGLAADVLGGWQVSGIGDYEGGFPFGIIDNYYGINGYNRPDTVAGVARKTYNYSLAKDYFKGELPQAPQMFTVKAFALTSSPYTLGDGRRAYPELRTPPLRDESFSAIKSFAMGEKVSAKLRVDYFNAFNRTQLAGPDTDMSDPTFGMVLAEGSQLINRQGQVTFRVDF